MHEQVMVESCYVHYLINQFRNQCLCKYAIDPTSHGELERISCFWKQQALPRNATLCFTIALRGVTVIKGPPDPLKARPRSGTWTTFFAPAIGR